MKEVLVINPRSVQRVKYYLNLFSNNIRGVFDTYGISFPWFRINLRSNNFKGSYFKAFPFPPVLELRAIDVWILVLYGGNAIATSCIANYNR